MRADDLITAALLDRPPLHERGSLIIGPCVRMHQFGEWKGEGLEDGPPGIFMFCVQEIHIAGVSQQMCLRKWYVSWQAGSAKKPAAIEVNSSVASSRPGENNGMYGLPYSQLHMC